MKTPEQGDESEDAKNDHVINRTSTVVLLRARLEERDLCPRVGVVAMCLDDDEISIDRASIPHGGGQDDRP